MELWGGYDGLAMIVIKDWNDIVLKLQGKI